MHQAGLALALRHDHHFAAVRAYANLAETIEIFEEFAEGDEVRLRALELARLAGEKTYEAIFLSDSAFGLHALGRWDEALMRVGEAEVITDLSYVRVGMAAALPIRCARGDLQTARAELRRLAALGESDDPQAIAAYGAAESAVLRAEGRPAEALPAAERALGMRGKLGVCYWAVKAAFVEAIEAAFVLEDEWKVREHLSTIAALAPGLRTPLLRGHEARFEARLDPVGDANGFGTAAEIFRGLGTPFYLAVTLLEHGESLVEQGRASEAAPLLAEAREAFERLGAAPWLERVTGATGNAAAAGARA